MTDAKKQWLYDDIRFPQLRFHCKYYKKMHIEVSVQRKLAKFFLTSEGFLFLVYFFPCLVGFPPKQKFSTATSPTQPSAHYSDNLRNHNPLTNVSDF